MKLRWARTVLFALLVFGSPAVVGATSIEYRATDLVDVNPGNDLWQYEYYVSGFDFLENEGFSVYFDLLRYESLQELPIAPNPAWDVLTFQLEPVLPSDGVYDAMALNDHASLADPFVVSFVWLGGAGTQPGAQLFDVYSLQTGTFEVLESGQTAPVADPPSLLVILTAVAFGGVLRRRFGT